MNIVNHPMCTQIIGAPSDMQHDCDALPIAIIDDEHGRWSVSFWQPTAGELHMLQQGGGVALRVRATGRQHPVVGMSTYSDTLTCKPTPEQIAAWAKRNDIREEDAAGAYEDAITLLFIE